MLTIQFAFGPRRSKQRIVTDPMHQNGHSSGGVHRYTSSPDFMPTERLHTRLAKKVREFCSLYVSQLNRFAGTFPKQERLSNDHDIMNIK